MKWRLNLVYREVESDLFKVNKTYYLAHCISADFAMAAGIVVEFNKEIDMKSRLKKKYPDYIMDWIRNSRSYDCLLEDRVFNLVTKTRYYNKPTYNSLTGALVMMRDLCNEKGINKIAMPLIGCGLDRLMWSRVSKIIKDTFVDTDIDILVCVKK